MAPMKKSRAIKDIKRRPRFLHPLDQRMSDMLVRQEERRGWFLPDISARWAQRFARSNYGANQ